MGPLVKSAGRATKGDALLGAVPLFGVALLLANDHVLKRLAPGVLTGKLSDVAGMLFFPLLLVALAELAGAPRRRAVLVAAVVATGVVFALVKVWSPANDAYAWAAGLAQWPFRALLLGARPVLPAPTRLDASDLVALPALLVAYAHGVRRLRDA